MSVPRSRLLPRSFHQEQPLRSRCRSINTALLRQKMPSYLHDAELSDETIGKALSSPLFSQEREEPASRRQAYHSFEESLLSSQSLSVCHVSTGRPVNELGSLSSFISREMENESREELQKSHVLKVKEFSRRKLTERLPRSNFILPGLECQDSLTTLVTTTRSTQMLILTTSTPGIRWLHHGTFRSEKQVRSCCRFITRKRESLFQGAQSILASTERTRNAPSVQQGSRCNRVFCWTLQLHWNWMSHKAQI